MSLSRNQLNDFLREIDITDKVCLDVGVQDKPTSRLTKGTPREYKTLDIDPNWGADIVADLNSEWSNWITKVYNIKTEHYDIIFCIEVLEHCWNPVQAIQNMAGVLSENGMLYISTPFINPHHDYVDYLRFTNEWYRDVLPNFGLKVINIRERLATAGRGLLEGFYKAEGLRVSKIRPEYGKYTYPIGYFVEAQRV